MEEKQNGGKNPGGRKNSVVTESPGNGFLVVEA